MKKLLVVTGKQALRLLLTLVLVLPLVQCASGGSDVEPGDDESGDGAFPIGVCLVCR